MRSLATIFSVWIFLLSAPAYARTMMIPEAMPGTAEYEQARSIIEQARTSPKFGYQKTNFYTVIAESAVYAVSAQIQMYILVNGKYFQIPLEYNHIDNWNTWARRRGDKRGIYLISRGHRRARGILWRVVATVRLTQLDGTPFSNVEYSEEATVEPCPECIR